MPRAQIQSLNYLTRKCLLIEHLDRGEYGIFEAFTFDIRMPQNGVQNIICFAPHGLHEHWVRTHDHDDGIAIDIIVS